MAKPLFDPLYHSFLFLLICISFLLWSRPMFLYSKETGELKDFSSSIISLPSLSIGVGVLSYFLFRILAELEKKF